MCHGQLFPRGGFDHFTDAGNLALLFGGQPHSERLNVRDHKTCRVRDVHGYGSEVRNLDLCIEVRANAGSFS